MGPNDIKLYESNSHMGDFIDCMRSRKDPIATVEMGHRSNTVCVLHHIAMKLERKLQWDPKQEKFVDDSEANKMLDYERRPGWEI